MADIFSDIGNWWNTLFQPQTAATSNVTKPTATVPYKPTTQNVTGVPSYTPIPNQPMWPQSEINQAIAEGRAVATTPTWGQPMDYVPSPYNPVTSPPVQSNPRTYDDGTYTYVWDETGTFPGWVKVGPSQTSINEQNRIAQEEADRKFTEDARRWGLEYALSQQNVAARQQEAASTQQYQQQQLAAEQAWRTQQIEAEKQQRLATLAAQPKSWLEYAALSNQPPVVQPWMLPLMPQDYQQNQAVGSQIAGWTPENMKGMPDLINPSAQYMARLTPSAREQYYGYQQADQGQTPEDTQWRLWSQGPAGGKMSLSQPR